MKTVEEYFDIDEIDLAERSCDSDYWAASESFYLENKATPVRNLSKKQMSWLMKIENELEIDEE